MKSRRDDGLQPKPSRRPPKFKEGKDNYGARLARHSVEPPPGGGPKALAARPFKMLRFVSSKTLLALAALLLLAPAVSAQQRPVQPPTFPEDRMGRRPRGPLGSPEDEIIKRAEIKRSEQTHAEMVERADEAARLGLDLRAAFDKQKSLGREDLKRLEKLEKLARKIRSNAGGEDDDEPLKDPPAALQAAMARLAEVSVKLNEGARKTTRLVVSGTVIEYSNELIELVRHIRTFVKP